ncbi:MAG: AI-2E family transporter [Burkholderiales bacterium]|jgi:predicted PurR-regulated permease PerM|nr:AI-2E family transporter [Burkholderiales bacterium]
MPDTQPDDDIQTPPDEATVAPDPLPSEEAPEPERVLLHMPVGVRSVSLAVLAVLATVFALHWASAVFIPLMLGITFSYALTPIVDRMARVRIPRAIGAALLMTSMLGGVGWTAYALSDDATTLIESLPDAAQKVRLALRAKRNRSETAMDKMQRAATQLEQAAQEGSSTSPSADRGVTRVQIERPKFNIKDYFWTGTLGLVALLGQASVVLFITFFLLASGNTFRRKMVKLAGPTFAKKKITVQALDEITEQIQRYLLVQAFTSIVVGIATGLSFLLIGVQHAAVWGVAACVLNFIPYIGSLVITAASALVGFVQFGSVHMALLVAGVSLVLHTISGYLLTPWLTSRASRMNAVVVFVGVLSFGWLWGVWGLLLGVPILMMVKAVCDRVDDLKAIGELLGT